MIFVDTGAWVARFSKRDQYHGRAVATWTKLRGSNQRIFTSDSVFAETITLLAREVCSPAAVEAGRYLHSWNRLTILRATPADEITALGFMEKFADQTIGFVDCMSFSLMHRYRISTAFSFDRHFELAGVPILK